MENICKSFSGVYANRDINLTVEKGSIHALLGENGAGKTTLMNILFGIYTADSGKIFWKENPVTFSSPGDAINAGIGMVQQHFSLVRNMTVLDNIILNLKGNRFQLDRASAERKIRALAEKYGLTVDPKAKVADLSIGEQQRAEILKALFRDVELLILDEPTGVLTPQEITKLFDVLRNLKKEGYGIIIITHHMNEIMEISDRVTVLRDGMKVCDRITAETGPEELSNDMIGRELKENFMGREKSAPLDETMLEVKNLSMPGKHGSHPLSDISFTVRKGEILGVAGVEGNGQKELAEAVTGIRRHYHGSISLKETDMERKNVRERYDAGITYISDDRQNDSLILSMNISENLMLRDYNRKPFSRNGIVDRKTIGKNAEEKTEKYSIRASGKTGISTPVRLLSGGNQQKLIIARELSEKAELIVASQPTRGLDIGATEFVRKKLTDFRDSGKSILLISADLEEIMELSDRIAVLSGGKVMGILDRKDATVERLGLMMGGIAEKEVVS